MCEIKKKLEKKEKIQFSSSSPFRAFSEKTKENRIANFYLLNFADFKNSRINNKRIVQLFETFSESFITCTEGGV